jgi:PAS domain S-box-containing protein
MQILFRQVCRWACIALVALLALARWDSALPETSRSASIVVNAGVLNHWPPQYQLDHHGQPTGFAVDLIEQVAGAAGLRVEYTVMDSWGRLFDALRSGKIDLIPNLGITEERKQWFAFTAPVETFPIVIFIRRSTFDILGPQDLAGRAVGTVRYNVGTRLMQQRSDIELNVFQTLKEAFLELLAGHVDALVYPQPVMMKLALDAGLEETIKRVGEPLLEVKRAISVRKDNRVLLDRLESTASVFVSSDAYQRTYTKWYGEPKPFWTPKRIVLIMTTVILISSIVGVVWHYIRTTSINRRLRQSIKDRQSAEEALRSSEEKYRLIVEYQNDLILKLASDGRILFASPSIRELLGCSSDEIIGTNLLSLVHPQDYENVQLATQSLQVAPHFCRYEARCLTTRNWKWFFWSNKAVLDPTGQLLEIIAVGRDITKRKRAELRLKESEEKFRAIFEHAADSVLLLNADSLAIVDFNVTAHQSLGFTRKEFKQFKLHDLLAVEPPETVAGMVRKILAADLRPVEALLRTKSGQIRYCRIRQQAITISDHNYSLGFWHDITDRKMLEERLMHSQKMEAIGTLAGGVAHDFNNILAIIIGNTELALLDTSDTHPLNQQLKEIQTAGQRARDVVAQLRSFSRQDEARRLPVELGGIIDESLQLLRVSIPTTIDIKKKPCRQPLTVLSDSTQIQQVLINLCTNAAHAMEAGGGTLTVSLKKADLDRAVADKYGLRSGAYAQLTVEDTGTGIDPAILDRIFDPYFTTKQTHSGTGMGLAMVHGIVTKYDGGISVNSQPGRGSQFRVFLPLCPAIAKIETPCHAESFSGRGRLLLIDDEPSILNLGTQYLSQLGYEVHSSDDAVEALKLFQRAPERYDLVITDMTMPKLTGEMLAREILTINPDIPVIMCSGYPDDDIRNRITAAGVKIFLQKPYQMRTLAKAIQQALTQSDDSNGGPSRSRGQTADAPTPSTK